MRSPRAITAHLEALVRDEAGAAAVEFALVSFVLALFLLNGMEFARYLFLTMQVENAAHAAAMSVWGACDTTHSPAQTSCNNAQDPAILKGLRSTALGSSVTEVAGTRDEGYYCVNASGALVKVALVTAARPDDCSAQGDASHAPGDYIKITASAPYHAMFMGVGFVTLVPSTITSTASMRLL